MAILGGHTHRMKRTQCVHMRENLFVRHMYFLSIDLCILKVCIAHRGTQSAPSSCYREREKTRERTSPIIFSFLLLTFRPLLCHFMLLEMQFIVL